MPPIATAREAIHAEGPVSKVEQRRQPERRTAASEAHPVLALQRLVGNRTVAGVLATHIQRQRQRQPPSGQRLDDIERRQHILEKRQSILELDLRWRGRFGEQLSGWRQAVLRITAGLEAAHSGFQRAQIEQQQFDQLATQLFLAAASVSFAAGFEPLLSARLGRAGRTAEEIKDIVERIENPAIQAVGTSGNIVGSLPRDDTGAPSQSGQPDGITGSPMAFLAGNLEALEGHNRAMEQAFTNRMGGLRALTDEEIEAFNVDAQDQVYAGLLQRLLQAARSIDQMAPAATVATILERHLWAQWLRSSGRIPKPVPMEGSTRPSGITPADVPTLSSNPNVSISGSGSYIEDRLNQIGVSQLAGVQLSGHWYSPNSPAAWQRMLVIWAFGYRQSISIAT